MNKVISGAIIFLWATPLVLANIAPKTFPDPGSFNGDSWTAIGEGERIQFAGILSRDNQSKLTGVRYHCDATTEQVQQLNFAIPVSHYAKLFVVSELVPGLNDGNGQLQVTVDDSEGVTLSPVVAGMIEGSAMLVSSSALSETSVEDMMAGSNMRVDLFYNGNLMFTDTVSLSGSEKALSELNCLKN